MHCCVCWDWRSDGMNEVIERVDLIVSVQGSRRISLENLQFLFNKYDLSETDREAVLEHCRTAGITVFEELTPEEREPKTSPTPEVPAPKKSLFARLFGR